MRIPGTISSPRTCGRGLWLSGQIQQIAAASYLADLRATCGWRTGYDVAAPPALAPLPAPIPRAPGQSIAQQVASLNQKYQMQDRGTRLISYHGCSDSCPADIYGGVAPARGVTMSLLGKSKKYRMRKCLRKVYFKFSG